MRMIPLVSDIHIFFSTIVMLSYFAPQFMEFYDFSTRGDLTRCVARYHGGGHYKYPAHSYLTFSDSRDELFVSMCSFRCCTSCYCNSLFMSFWTVASVGQGCGLRYGDTFKKLECIIMLRR